MLRRTSTLLVAIALALPLGPGCNKKQELTEVAVPEAGVSLRYDLTPGQTYAGHVKMSNTVQTPMGDIRTSLEFDVALVVSANKVGDAMLVRATVEQISLNMRLPDGIPAAAAGGMTPETAASLNGIELRFNINERGEVSDLPEPPESAPMPVKGIIGMLTSGLTAGLAMRLPVEPIKDGESWDAKSDKPDEGVVSSTNTGTLGGLGRSAGGEDIAQLAYTAQIESKRAQGGQELTVKQEIDTKASFSATGGYPVEVERKINNEIVGQATIYIEVAAEWQKGEKQAVEAAPPAVEEVQAPTDPCDPDYAGMEECVEDAAPPADAAPADAAPADTAPAKSK